MTKEQVFISFVDAYLFEEVGRMSSLGRTEFDDGVRMGIYTVIQIIRNAADLSEIDLNTLRIGSVDSSILL